MVITTGCTQALHGMIRLLAQPGDVVACEAPAYYATLEMLGDTGIRVLPIPVRDSHGVDLDLVATLFERFHPKFFVVCSTLSNPSGATMSNEARRALVEICRKTGTRILEDEIYGELSEIDGLRPIRSYDDGNIVSYVMSFSKTVAPGHSRRGLHSGREYGPIRAAQMPAGYAFSHLVRSRIPKIPGERRSRLAFEIPESVESSTSRNRPENSLKSISRKKQWSGFRRADFCFG